MTQLRQSAMPGQSKNMLSRAMNKSNDILKGSPTSFVYSPYYGKSSNKVLLPSKANILRSSSAKRRFSPNRKRKFRHDSDSSKETTPTSSEREKPVKIRTFISKSSSKVPYETESPPKERRRVKCYSMPAIKTYSRHETRNFNSARRSLDYGGFNNAEKSENKEKIYEFDNDKENLEQEKSANLEIENVEDLTPTKEITFRQHDKNGSFEYPRGRSDEFRPWVQTNSNLEPCATLQPYEIGFPNPAGMNRCWLNATLQVVLGLSPAIRDVLRLANGRRVSSSVFRAFAEVVRAREKGQPLAVHRAVGSLSRSLNAIFSCDGQEDASEFLVKLLDNLREECQRLSSKLEPLSDPLKETSDPDNNNTAAAGPIPLITNYSEPDGLTGNPIRDNVEFWLTERYTCKSCSHKSSMNQDNLALFLNIPPTNGLKPSLQKAIENYLNPEDRELKCSKCPGQMSDVRTYFKKLPRFFIIQVKRFAFQNTVPEKLTDAMKIPIHINLETMLSDDASVPFDWKPDENTSNTGEEMEVEQVIDLADDGDNVFDENQKNINQEELDIQEAIKLSLCDINFEEEFEADNETDEPDEEEDISSNIETSYRIIGVISHHGLTPNSGHYIAKVYNLVDNSWYLYDDEKVTQIAEESVLGQSQKNGYVFIYMHRPLFNTLATAQK